MPFLLQVYDELYLFAGEIFPKAVNGNALFFVFVL